MKYLDLAIANEQIKTTPIKGKDYAEVNQRIKAFRMVYPEGTITTTMLNNENGICIFRATVANGEIILGTGTAYEKEDSSFINKTSYIENCETSAVGRALGMAGFGIDVSVVSAEEMQNAINNQTVTEEEAHEYKLTFGKFNGKTIKEIFEEKPEYLDWLVDNTKDERLLKIIEIETGITIPSEEEQTEILTKMSEVMTLAREKEINLEDIINAFKAKRSKIESLKDFTKEELELAIKKLEEK